MGVAASTTATPRPTIAMMAPARWKPSISAIGRHKGRGPAKVPGSWRIWKTAFMPGRASPQTPRIRRSPLRMSRQWSSGDREHSRSRGGNAQMGGLTTMYDGKRPTGYNPMKKQGAIVLGIGGDNTSIGSRKLLRRRLDVGRRLRPNGQRRPGEHRRRGLRAPTHSRRPSPSCGSTSTPRPQPGSASCERKNDAPRPLRCTLATAWPPNDDRRRPFVRRRRRRAARRRAAHRVAPDRLRRRGIYARPPKRRSCSRRARSARGGRSSLHKSDRLRAPPGHGHPWLPVAKCVGLGATTTPRSICSRSAPRRAGEGSRGR